MTTTTPKHLSLRAALLTDPQARWYLGHAFAMRQAASWDVPNAVNPATRKHFRGIMGSSARLAIHSARHAMAVNGGAL